MTKLTVNKELSAEYRKLRAEAKKNGEPTWKIATLPQFKGYWVEPDKRYGKDVWYVYYKPAKW